MRARNLAVIFVAAGCNISVMDAPATALRIEPASIDLDVDLAQPAPEVQLRVFATRDDGTEDEVTGDATFTLDGAQLGPLTASTLTSDGATGGSARVRVAYQQLAASIPATAYVHERRIGDGIPAAASGVFMSVATTAVDAQLDPPDGAVVPASLGRLVVSFSALDSDDVSQLIVTAPYLDLEIVTLGVAGPRAFELSPAEWAAASHTARGGSLQLDVTSLRSTDGTTARSATASLEIADLDASSLLVGGAVGAPGTITDGSANRPSLWRYDMHAGAMTAMFTNPAGACIGCHLAVSADGSRLAALIVSPTAPMLNGVVLDGSDGSVLAQSDGSGATPWATAAFDPGGQLLAAWQGQLTVRDPDTGAITGTVASRESASAPTISPDGTAVAYVTLDAGSGAAASQPIGNALHVRPWNAATATVGGPIELARAPAGVVLPMFSSDGMWVAYGEGTPDPTRLNEVPVASFAVRADGSGTRVPLTSSSLDQLAHFASPVALARAGGRAPEPMVWVAVSSARAVGGATTSSEQLWLEAFYPARGVVSRPFHLPGQPELLQVLHGPVTLP